MCGAKKKKVENSTYNGQCLCEKEVMGLKKLLRSSGGWELVPSPHIRRLTTAYKHLSATLPRGSGAIYRLEFLFWPLHTCGTHIHIIKNNEGESRSVNTYFLRAGWQARPASALHLQSLQKGIHKQQQPVTRSSGEDKKR